jgi:hypothetical protein
MEAKSPCAPRVRDRALDPGAGGDDSSTELGGGQALWAGLRDQQRLLSDGRALGIAVLGVLMFAAFGASLDDRLATLDLPPEAKQQLEEEKIKLGAAEVPDGVDAALGATVERAIDEAFVSGYRVVMLVATALALASMLSAALLIEGK